jgi:hypothetical protein
VFNPLSELPRGSQNFLFYQQKSDVSSFMFTTIKIEELQKNFKTLRRSSPFYDLYKQTTFSRTLVRQSLYLVKLVPPILPKEKMQINLCQQNFSWNVRVSTWYDIILSNGYDGVGGWFWCGKFGTRVFSKQLNFFLVRTKTNRNSICFSCFSVCFAKPKNICFGLFRCSGPVTKQTEFSQNKPKQTEKIFKKRSLLGGPRNC